MPRLPKAIVGRVVAVAIGSACACSALAVREDDCKTDDDCSTAFGPGYTCSADGSCEPPDAVDPESTGTTIGETDTDTDTDTETDTDACGELGCPVALADECSAADIPVLSSSADFVVVDTNPLNNDFDELSCLATAPTGKEGFFAVELAAGERWHFHVRVTDSEANPSVYVLRACDERTCQPGDAIDLCGDGADEHVSFVAAQAGLYYVGVDGRKPGGAVLQVLAVQPTCGNGGTPEHSESCDDGNTMSGDGCDDRCRAELTANAPTELEPNDDRVAANVVMLDEDTNELTVTGAVGGRCDFDNFLVAVPDGGSVRATMLAAGEQQCAPSAPPITMLLLAPDGVTVLGEGRSRGGNACPSIGESDMFAADLAAGDYFVRVFTGEAQDAFDYALALQVVVP